MDKQTIKIQISGYTATGKSTIMWAIIKMLKEHGIDVEMATSVNSDYKSIEHLQHAMEHDFDNMSQRLNVIKDKSRVEICEVVASLPAKSKGVVVQ